MSQYHSDLIFSEIELRYLTDMNKNIPPAFICLFLFEKWEELRIFLLKIYTFKNII